MLRKFLTTLLPALTEMLDIPLTHEFHHFSAQLRNLGLMDGTSLWRRLEEEMLPKFRRQSRGQMDAVDRRDLHQLTLLAFATRWTCRVCPLPLANGMTLPTISTTGFLTVSIPKRR